MDVLAFLLVLLFGAPAKAVVADTSPEPREQRSVNVPWPMHCNFIVRVIEGPGDRVVVASKRDCD